MHDDKQSPVQFPCAIRKALAMLSPMRNLRGGLASVFCFAITCSSLPAASPPGWLVPLGKRQVVCKQIETPAGPRVVLENGFLRAEINPSRGGAIESFRHKRTLKDLTMPQAETVPGGLLSDHLWQQDYWRGDWDRVTYAVKVLDQTPELVRVELTSPTGRNWTGVSFAKTLTLRRDSSVLEANCTIAANDQVDKRCRPDIHFPQALAGRGQVFLPTEAGVLARPLSIEPESWVWDPSRGWVGYIQESGTALGAMFDYKRIRGLRTSQHPALTMEWILRKIELKPGSKLETPVRLAAFSGLKEISAIGDRLALDLRVEPPKGRSAKVRMALAPFENFKAEVVLSVRSLSDGRETLALERSLGCEADEPTEFTSTVRLDGEGNWVVKGIVRADGMPDLHFEKPVIVPQGKGTYTMVPEAERIPEVPDSPTYARYKPIDLNFNSTAIPTPHRVWAKPWAGGRPRLLALMPEGSERIAVELAQRFDVDLTCAYLCDNTYYVLGDGVRSLKLETVKANLDKTVERDFDVIALSSSDAWPLLTPKAKQRVLEMVKNGAGLVVFQRGAPPEELKEFMPLEFIGYDHASGIYTLVTNSPPVLAAFPYEAMPVSFYSNGSRLRTNTTGTVLLKAVLPGPYAERGPLVAVGQIGRGRLVQAQTEGWLVQAYGKFITMHQPDAKPPPFDYWEYHYAMTARMIYWAARKESPVQLTDVTCSASEVKVVLDSTIAERATIELTLRDEFGGVVAQQRHPVELQTATGLTFALPVSGWARLADVIVSNSRGVLAFGGGSFPQNDVRFVKVTPEKLVYLPGDTATIIATITNTIPQGAIVRAQLFDGSGRHVASAEATATAETKLALPLARVIGPIYSVRASLVAGDRVLDQDWCESRIKAVRRPELFRAMFWGGVGGSVPQNLIEATFERHRSMGMNAEFEGEGPLGHDKPFLQRLNWPHSAAAVGMYTSGGVTKEQAATNKVETGNIICSPDAPARNFEAGAKRGAIYKDDDVLIYSCGDENRGSGKDVDFSESGKRELRKFVQAHFYKTIADLNREWGTAFSSFDEVIAMTEAEAREHLKTAKSCGPWLDQRLWINWGAARLAKSITDGVRSTDPDAIVGESGSQEPAVYGTDRDWWHMSRSYTGLAAYGGEQTVEQECYNPSLVRYTWSGYGKPNPLNRAQFYNILSRFDRGLAIFAARSHIDPDFTLSESGRDVQAALLELQRGIGQMLVSAEVVRDPVFILQSSSSLYGAHLLGLGALHSSSRTQAMRLLDDLGIEYQYISYEQLAAGELKKKDCRVLVLPATICLSPEQCAAIRDWVKAGGTILADMKTALMTEHGRLYAKPELEDVFGVDRSQAEAVDAESEPWTGNDESGKPVLKLKTVERGITGAANLLGQVTGPRGTVPIVFHNIYGKGHGYYLAADILGGYGAATDIDQANASVEGIHFLQRLFDQILGEAGVRPNLSVRLRDAATGKLGARCPWVWTGFKRSGQSRYAIVLRNYSALQKDLPDVPVTVQFAEPGVIYDVVAGKLLGHGDSVDLTMINATGRVFAILPSEVLSVDMQSPPKNLKPGEDLVIPIEVKVASGKADPRVLHVGVMDPAGKPHPAYSSNLICAEGKGVVKIPFALNDKRGEWSVRVTDVASGAANTFKVTLQ